jgi:hypothetical protein
MKPVRRSGYQAYDKQITKRMVENANTETPVRKQIKYSIYDERWRIRPAKALPF